jgi:hypothetical protein
VDHLSCGRKRQQYNRNRNHQGPFHKPLAAHITLISGSLILLDAPAMPPVAVLEELNVGKAENRETGLAHQNCQQYTESQGS